MNKPFLPLNSVIGIIGGGQLGQMMAIAAKEMGYRTILLDPVATSPCSQIADEQIVASYDDKSALRELALKSDIVTYEFENVDEEALQSIEKTVQIPQGTELLSITQDRILEKAYLGSCNINIAPYAVVVDQADIKEKFHSIGYPAVLKTARGGYDGKGQVILRGDSDLKQATKLFQHGSCVLEAWIPFKKEISVIVARNNVGQIEVFPISENVHKNNILHTSTIPAHLEPDIAEESIAIARRLAEYLGLQGVMTVEMFVTSSGAIYVNELAPRPHNSGHYTIEACNISQFAMHIRAIAGLPLIKPELFKEAVMINVLGQHLERVNHLMSEKKYADWFVHFYGKKVSQENRKMGHITILTQDIDQTLKDLKETKIWN